MIQQINYQKNMAKKNRIENRQKTGPKIGFHRKKKVNR
jgi:hypothetical protein